jgi:AAA+ ATPase superfamily predicted ATPase
MFFIIFVAKYKFMIIGRQYEISLLNQRYNSNKSEFVALYGRRRVGKTYLVKSLFEGKLTFHLTGVAQATYKDQLSNFNITIRKQYPKKAALNATNWMEAFEQISLIIEKSKQKKKIIFIDELPWFDTARSRFIQALEHFWNSWASSRTDILLIVCGSAASWMINTLINNRGGLHNRITQKIKIEPFNLRECEEFLLSKKISFPKHHVIQLYMVLGGIPFYWDEIKRGLSASQNIDQLCFERNGFLVGEFNKLFKSLFAKAERHEAIISAMSKKNKGLTREEISTHTHFTTGGTLTTLLEELEESGFIRKYVPFGKKERNSLYQLCDFFSLFHVKFIKGQKRFEKNHWKKMIDHPKVKAWSGYAFEQACLMHSDHIKKGLGISGVSTEESAWKSTKSKNGAQIDLLIDRRDGVINVCEMKFSTDAFIIDKKYDKELSNKLATFRAETVTKKALFLTMITTHGIKENTYSVNVQNDLKMDVLFEKIP